MKIEVLVSTMNLKDLSLVKKMNVTTDIVIGNQCGKNKKETKQLLNQKIKVVSSDTRGVAKNRNIALDNATGDICIIADDDLVYVDKYDQVISTAFQEHPNADIIIFNLYEEPVSRYVIMHRFRVTGWNYMRFGAVRICFRLKSIQNSKVRFDERFGPGGNIPLGEDTIFLSDCLKAKLKIIALPAYILSLTNERESTWFKGYDKLYFQNKGKMFKRISPKFYKLLCLQDVIRHQDIYGNWKKNYKEMVDNAKSFKV